jgi:hypothetical protein
VTRNEENAWVITRSSTEDKNIFNEIDSNNGEWTIGDSNSATYKIY